ncbi:interferon-inducible GTPase 5 [Silurus asotus]|uniref:Interferon-inducible GTPase 5 n=1 Tax=Silurus asotus TaxID=30991 RepID=A0AAD5F9U1_SILAS|nr:interferon-inducible GTPase 5 [Silurus asotus]
MENIGFTVPQKIPEEYINKIIEAIQSTKLENIPQQFMTLLKVYDQFKLDVAVTGDSGSGKSTLINALLGLEADAKGAAPTGVVETTMKPAVYQHPYCSQVRLWDLPGMGTPSFTSKSYVETMNFNLFDMFFVVISERFRENNMLLIDEIQKQNKPFYVIRTKVDSDLRAQSRKHNFTETGVLSEMRDDCLKYLEEKNLHPHIFLVSAHNTHNYEMQKLMNTFEKEVPELKKKGFALFLVNLFSGDRRKQRTIRLHALQSGKINDKEVLELKDFCRCFDVSNGTETLTTSLEAVDHFQLDVAILGETGSGVTTLLNCLIRQQDDTFCSVLTEMPATSPQYPNVRFWAVSGIENIILNSLESMTESLDHFDFYVLIVTEWKKAHHIDLARVVQKLRKQYTFVQTKTDCHLQAQKDLCCSETEILDGLRAQCAEELQRAEVDSSQLFLVNCLDRKKFDFVGLESVLGCNLDTIRRSAFAYYVDKIVRNKKQAQSSCQIL